MTKLRESLTSVCRDQLLAEKWLIAPSLRVGHQWLDAVTRSGQPAVNVRIKTLRRLALELAGPAMASAGLTLISGTAAAFLVSRILHDLKSGPKGYLLAIEPTIGLAETVSQTIHALRLAGLTPKELSSDYFEVPTKGKELATILHRYAEELAGRKLLDYPGALALAVSRLRQDQGALADGVVILLPADIQLRGLERQLVEALAKDRLLRLEVDQTGRPGEKTTSKTDLGLLRWLASPANAPPPVKDDTVVISRAIGEINEVRHALRQCLAAGFSLDDVEVLHTDVETYVSLIYEAAKKLGDDGGPLSEGLPVTFAEGIPAIYTRPGRALAAWAEWIQSDYPQALLTRMIQDGLLQIDSTEDGAISLSRLAATLRPIGIGFGRDRYLPKIDEQIAVLGEEAKATRRDEDGEVDEEGRVKAQRRLDATRLLRVTIERLLAGCPRSDAPPGEIFRAATEFLRANARCVTESDNLARMKLVADIEELVLAIGDHDDFAGVNATEHLAALPRQSRFGGSGPRPGHLHVAHVLAGGHSGRSHTFIIGLDDSRFPGGGYQDPLLLDSEKARLSPDLQTSAEDVRARLDAFCQLIARLRGTLALSFSCRSIADDREMFPSPVVLAAWRVVSGNHDADQGDLLAKIPPPASFAPADADQCTDQAEWWLWRLCGPPIKDGVGVIARQFPHLGRGIQAIAQRAAPIFGSHDGLVPEAGKLHDPLAAEGPIMSASGLQTIGRCPLAYFFERILRIKPPDEFTVDPSQWLDALQFGSLLHQVLCQFMRELVTTGKLPPVCKRDAKRLQQILDLRIKEYRDLVPPPSENVFQMQCRRLEWATQIFLIEEEQFCQTNRPLYLEASIGMESDGEGTPLDTADPIPIRLPNGRQIRTRGRIDRIDQFGDPADATYSIWDYKSGGTWKYEQDPPFWQGRIIQHAIYCEMALAQLRKIDRKAKIAQVGYFFPERRATGQRIAYRPEDLKDAGRIVQNLCEAVRAGAFLATNEAGDCGYCDYACVCGDPKVVAAASQAKLDEPANRMLEPIRQLRSQGDGEE